tara:strand:- start:12392 stop:12973 length:582 start_codon:yes stop_codon:yes gene_type:complete
MKADKPGSGISGSLHSAVDDCAQVVSESWAQQVAGQEATRQEPAGAVAGGLRFASMDYGSDAYKQTLALRERVLRQPLGLSLWDENLTEESRQLHFGLLNTESRPVACLVVVSLTGQAVKIRQMAVDPDYQGQGLGRKLMQRVEQWLMARGVKTATLHARTTAVGFYESLGYVQIGAEFAEVGIPHCKMTRNF